MSSKPCSRASEGLDTGRIPPRKMLWELMLLSLSSLSQYWIFSESPQGFFSLSLILVWFGALVISLSLSAGDSFVPFVLPAPSQSTHRGFFSTFLHLANILRGQFYRYPVTTTFAANGKVDSRLLDTEPPWFRPFYLFSFANHSFWFGFPITASSRIRNIQLFLSPMPPSISEFILIFFKKYIRLHPCDTIFRGFFSSSSFLVFPSKISLYDIYHFFSWNFTKFVHLLRWTRRRWQNFPSPNSKLYRHCQKNI